MMSFKKTLLPLLLVFNLLLSLAACSERKSETQGNLLEKNVTVTELSGEAVTEAEVEFFEGRFRSKIIAEFAEKGADPYSGEFWNTEIDGTTPQEVLRSRALEEALKAKQILIDCKAAGIYDDISWEGLKKRAEQYNAEHKDGGVGLTKIDMNSFYLYYVDNGRLELENLNAE